MLAQSEESPYDCDEPPCTEDGDEDDLPYTGRVLSDHADALRSAGWGTDEDYDG